MAEQPRHREPSHQESTPQNPGRGEPYEVREPERGTHPGGREAYASGQPGYREGYREYEHRGGGRPNEPRHDTGESEAPFRHIGRRVSWGAIFAGVFVALSVQLLLSVLGIGIGAAAFDPTGAADPTAWTVGAAVWWVITGLIALFIGGWVAGHLATNPDRRDGAIHGVVTWSLATLIGVWMLTTTLGTMTAGAWTVVAEGQQLQMPAGIEEQIDPQQQEQQPQQQQDAMQDPQEMLDQAGEAVAHAGIWTFVAMVLGAAAAGLGGFLATPRNAPSEMSRRDIDRR
ncbi:hypothetical protein ACERK3_10015 [Phycisphaerales bacterium AB-hyl4]|uniref:Uncharacterized protein n=1 Tax=Natronomicrosphaera hydrolytica TaxID=3242702 RepID=A0ABV4U634_9BACT